ncbi:MAG: protein kinase [Planctomycetota bacterium]|nr:protein kinase [Planctomycetota bacterium]
MSERSQLTSLSMFESLDAPFRGRVREQMEERTFDPGARILARGEAGDALYVIREGRVHVRVPEADGTVRFETHLGAGDVFGEMALLTGEPRTADVVVDDSGPATCLILTRDQLDAVMTEQPAIADVLTRLLDERVLESRLLQQIGPYHVIKLLGRGQMASVFEGYHAILRRPVAVKMLSHVLVRRPGFLERFRAEAEVLASLRHPGIVRVHDACEGFGTWFIVMELLEGTDLGRRLEAKGPMDFAQVRRIVRLVAHALHHAHERGIIHRDVKPSNVFRDDAGRVQLVDFGVASGHRRGDDEVVLGTPAYAAPEVMAGEGIGAHTDVYALGQTAYTLLTGRPMFDDEDPAVVCAMQMSKPTPDLTEAIPNIPGDLASFIRQATAKDPAERFAGCLDVLDHFDAVGGPASAAGRERARIRVSWPPDAREQAMHAISAVQGLLWGYEELNAVVEGAPQPSVPDAAPEPEGETGEDASG